MELDEIRLDIIAMADRVYEILVLTEDGFMKNKSEFLAAALQEEGEVNKMERNLTEEIMKLSKAGADKKVLSNLAQMVEMLERIGDEATGLIERIEVKVHERLMLDEAALAQFNETYKAMKDSVSMMREYLSTKEEALKAKVIDNGFRVKEFVERYRTEHADRLVRGECTPMSANMYFDMLDFTGNIARHSTNVVKLG